eukprot:scaffold11760_cov69-Cyclotella_meneghiniana.AAC.3
MSAVAETLDVEFKKNNISKPECRGVDSVNTNQGLLTGQIPKNFKTGRTFTLLEFLYIDDGAFVFGSRADLIKGLKIIRKVFADFGLEMHIGSNGEASKTECVFYPTSEWFRNTTQTPLLQADPETDPDLFDGDSLPIADSPTQLALTSPQGSELPSTLAITNRTSESEQARKKRCDLLYDTCKETERIMLDSIGYVDFTKKFLYLGSSTSYDLRDDDDISRRISIASRSMGMLKNFWDNPSIDLFSQDMALSVVRPRS